MLREIDLNNLQARSLYKGMSSPLLGVAGINAITFGAYGNVLRLLPNQDSISSITLAGASAGLIQVRLAGLERRVVYSCTRSF